MIRCVHALYFHVFESVGGVYETRSEDWGYSGIAGAGPELTSHIFGMTGIIVCVLFLKTKFTNLQKYGSST